MKYLLIRDARIPALGLGTYGLWGDTAIQMVTHALQVGYRHIDTAQAYDNEAEVGWGIRRAGISRQDLFVTTKVWYTRLDRRQFLPSVEESLRKLRLDYVDLLLIHWPSATVPLQESLAELVKAREQGLTRHIGVSNFTLKMLEQSLEFGAPLITNQVEYHPFLQQQRMLERLKTEGLMFTAYSPLAKGQVVQHELLKQIAEKYQKTPAQIALRWLIQQEHVAAIPRSTKAERISSNLHIFDFELSGTDMQQISSLGRENRRLINPSWAPQWDPPG